MDRRGNREKEFSPLAKFTELHSWWTTFAAWINGTFKMVRSLHGLRETTKTNSLPPSLRHQRLLLMTFPGKTTRDFSFLFFFSELLSTQSDTRWFSNSKGGRGGGERIPRLVTFAKHESLSRVKRRVNKIIPRDRWDDRKIQQKKLYSAHRGEEWNL